MIKKWQTINYAAEKKMQIFIICGTLDVHSHTTGAPVRVLVLQSRQSVRLRDVGGTASYKLQFQ